MIIIKRRGSAEDWAVYHHRNGAGNYQSLNTTEAVQSNNNRFNVAPTSSVFTVNTHESVNANGNTYIAYCFADVQGYSKFDMYTGNGNTDGPFVYTGFAPAFVLYKGRAGTGTTDNWEMIDNKRTNGPLGNPKNEVLYPNLNNAEGVNTTDRLDLLSNGFKIKQVMIIIIMVRNIFTWHLQQNL